MANSRLAQMGAYIEQQERVSIENLCRRFLVSKNTVRRDLNALAEQGAIIKVYGGAVSAGRGLYDQTAASEAPDRVSVDQRKELNRAAKNEIGRLAAELVKNGDTIFVDSGTTAICMIPFLAEKENVKLCSHSVPVLNLAIRYENLTVMGVGGQYNPSTEAFFGPETLDSISSFHFTRSFLGCTGMSIRNGLSNGTYYEPILKNHLIAKSAEVVLMADSSKIGVDSTRSVCPLTEIHTIITEQCPPDEYVEYCREHGIGLLYAD